MCERNDERFEALMALTRKLAYKAKVGGLSGAVPNTDVAADTDFLSYLVKKTKIKFSDNSAILAAMGDVAAEEEEEEE